MKEITPFAARTKFYHGESFVVETDGHKVTVNGEYRINAENGDSTVAWHKLISGYAIQNNKTYKIRFYDPTV